MDSFPHVFTSPLDTYLLKNWIVCPIEFPIVWILLIVSHAPLSPYFLKTDVTS